MSYHDDTNEIVGRLTSRLEEILSRYYPSWIHNHNKSKALLTPKVKPKQKRPTSSFTVDVRGPERGRWYRHSQELGGSNPVSLIFYAERGRLPASKEDWREAYQSAREAVGLASPRQISEEERQEQERRREKERQDRERKLEADRRAAARKRELRALTAQGICEAMVPIESTHAEAYLIDRGIPPVAEWPWNPLGVLGFVEKHEYESLAVWEDGRKVKAGPLLPAFIARCQDAFGDTVAVWQIFLDPVRPAKNTDVENAKLGLGNATFAGAAVRIGGIARRIGVAEGLESTLGDWFLEGNRMPVWSTLSTAGMRAFEVPEGVDTVDIYMDGDRGVMHVDKSRATMDGGRLIDPPGLAAGKALAARLKPKGLLGCFNEPPMNGDGLDLWNSVRKKIYVAPRGQRSPDGP